jgi:hypothetical protein
MADDMYMNKSGFKCTRLQLAKTDGYDPQEYERAKMLATQNGRFDEKVMADQLVTLKVKAPEHQ